MALFYLNNLQDLVEVQKISFFNFILKDLKKIFINYQNPFLKIQDTFYFIINNLKLKFPKITLNTCIEKEETYSFNFKILGHTFTIPKGTTKISIIKRNYLYANIPLLTTDGTFLINGCERIVISQIIKRPGVYFTSKIGKFNQIVYIATIISSKNRWVRLYLDEISQLNENFVVTKWKDIFYISLQDDKIVDLRVQKPLSFKNLKLKNLVLNQQIFEFFKTSYLNLLFNLQDPNYIYPLLKSYKKSNIQKLEYQDKKFLYNFFYGKESGRFYLDELGRDLFNKKFKIKNCYKNNILSIVDFLNIIKKLYDIKYNLDYVDNIDDLAFKQIRSIGELLKYFFEINLNIQFNSQKANFSTETQFSIDNTYYHTPYIYNFFVTSQLSQFADQTNPLSTITHKRKISLFGPEGLERERISIKLRDIHSSQYNRICPIETSEGQNAGIVTTLALNARISKYLNLESPYIFIKNSKIYLNSNLLFLDNIQEKIISIGFKNCRKIFDEISSFEDNILCKDQSNFIFKNINEIDGLVLSPLQMLSIGISLIPFVEHNDGNRALMGSNMQRQAVPLLNSNRSLVGTERDYNVAFNSDFVIHSYSTGILEYVSNQYIFIRDTQNQILRYILPKDFDNNQYLPILFKPTMWTNEKIFAGEIIASSSNIIENELALGSNLTVAYMTWEGYNFEDAIIINENLITNNILTSIHIDLHEEYTRLDWFHYVDFNNIFDFNGILKLGSYIYSEGPVIQQTKIMTFDPSFFLDKLTKKPTELAQYLIKDFIRIPSTIEGRLVKIKKYKTLEQDLFKIRFYLIRYSQIEIGDKLSGRHGNKGIISRILPKHEMPFMPNGDTVDLILNPLGVPSRMNVGQLFECLLGISGEKLGLRYKIYSFDESIVRNMSRIITNLFMSKTLYNFKRSWFYNKMSPGKLFLKDGRTGEYFDNSIMIGKAYILKLIHIIEHKIHARSLGPYSAITEQPLEGRANEGGQRFGEMEVWALESYGSSFTLQELLTLKSDNLEARDQIYYYLKNNNLTYLPIPVLPEAFILLINELRGLSLNIFFGKSDKNLYEKTYKKLSLFQYLESHLNLNKKI